LKNNSAFWDKRGRERVKRSRRNIKLLTLFIMIFI